MSKGLPGDLRNTIQQIKSPKPPQDGLTWLRHKLGTQAGECDLMLLNGFTTEAMAKELIRMGLDREKKGTKDMEARVLRHISTIRSGIKDLYNEHGHDLSSVLKEDSKGVWKFVIDDIDNNTLIEKKINFQSSPYLPNKEDFKKAYRVLAVEFGKEVSIDVALDQMERDATKKGKKMKPNWRKVTEANISIWQNDEDDKK
jgi:hypothetical protein